MISPDWRRNVFGAAARTGQPIILLADRFDFVVMEYPMWGLPRVVGCFRPTALGAKFPERCLEEGRREVLRRDAQAKLTLSVSTQMAKGKWGDAYPDLWDHLCQSVWEDGTVRKTSSLTVFTGDGLFKMLLKDKEAGLCLWVSAKTFDEAMKGLNAQCADPAAVWRVDRQEPGQPAARVKKKS